MSEPRVHNAVSGTVFGSVVQAQQIFFRVVQLGGSDGAPPEVIAQRVVRIALDDPARVAAAFAAGETGTPGEAARVWDAERAEQLFALVAQQLSEQQHAQQAHAALTKDVADRMLQLQSLVTALQPGRADAVEPSGVCPYPGLAAFGTEQAGWFFGRELLVVKLAGRLREQLERGEPLFVVGVSGVGKSSLLQAGLVPALRDGKVPIKGSAEWPHEVLRPGTRPLTALVECVARLSGVAEDDLREEPQRFWTLADRPIVLIIDQFEEIFSPDTDAAERRVFLTVITSVSGPALVVAGVRADFYAACVAEPLLVDVFPRNQFPVGPMSTAELRTAIDRPAQAAGLVLEGDLTDVMLDDLGTQPGALPLLGYALQATWALRREHTLTVAGYHQTGGVRGALAAAADKVHDRVGDSGEPVLRRLLLRLTATGDGVEPTRRRVPRKILVDEDAAVTVLDLLVAERLVTVAKNDEVEITHEALLRAWPRLAGWLAEDVTGLVVLRELTDAAAYWRDVGDTALYRGNRLGAAREWRRTNEHRLGPLERDFIDASTKAERRRGRRVVQLIAVLVVLMLAAAGGGVVALQQSDVAAAQRRIALSRAYAAESGAAHDNDPRRSLMLAIAAWQTEPTSQARGAALSAQASRYGGVLGTHTDGVWRVAASSGVVATGQSDGTVRLFDTRTRQQVREITGATAMLSDLALSPDGRTLVTAHLGDKPEELVRFWDVETGRLIRSTGEPAGRLAFSADGKWMVTGIGDRVRLWDAATGTKVRALDGQGGLVTAVAINADGSKILTGGRDKVIRMWDTANPAAPAVVGWHDAPVLSVAFSPQGTSMASASQDYTVRLWDLTGKQTSVLDAPGEALSRVTFSPDGSTVAAAAGRVVRRWDVMTGGELTPYGAHVSTVTDIAYEPDGQTVVSVSNDRTAVLWHVPTNFLGFFETSVVRTAFSPDGHTAAGAGGLEVRLWDVTGRTPLQLLTGHTDLVTGVEFSPDGATVASASKDGTVRLWNTETGALQWTISAGAGVGGVAFTPDGGTIAATVSGVGTVEPELVRWNARTGEELGRVRYHDGVGVPGRIVFSPDGKVVAVPLTNGHVELREGDTRVADLTGHTEQVVGVAFSPDGRTLATGGADRTVRLWDVATRKQIGTPLVGHGGVVRGVAFSPDGRTLASAGGDEAALRLWDVPAHQAFAVVSGHVGELNDVAFSRDGHTVVTASSDASLGVWNVDADAVVRGLCAVLSGGRPLGEEWAETGNSADTAPRCQ